MKRYKCSFIGIGSNKGNRIANIKRALELLSCDFAIRIKKVSKIYQTKPVGYTRQRDFLNLALEVYTNYTPASLLRRLKKIENVLGRHKTVKFGPRNIDLDILYYNKIVARRGNIVIPHPRLHERLFVLQPLMDIAPNFIHPLLRVTTKVLLRRRLNETSQKSEEDVRIYKCGKIARQVNWICADHGFSSRRPFKPGTKCAKRK